MKKITEPPGDATAGTLQFEYDENGYPTRITNQLGKSTVLEYEHPAADAADVSGNWEPGRTVAHLSQLVRRTDPKGVDTPTPTNDYQWQLDYDGNGNLLHLKDPEATVASPSYYTAAYTYNPDGTLAAATDANANTTTYLSYDASGLPTRVRDALNQETQAGYDAAGNLLWLQDAAHAAYTGGDPRQYRTVYDYDGFGRQGRSSTPKSTAFEPGTLIWSDSGYDPNDNVASQVAAHYGLADAGAGPTTTTVFDAIDRQTSVTSPDHGAGAEQTLYAYDDGGRLTKTTPPKGAATPADPLDYTTEYAYDQLDRIVQITQHPDAAASPTDLPLVNDFTAVTDSGCAGCSFTSSGTDEWRAVIAGGADTVDTAYGLKDFGGASGWSGRTYSRSFVRLAQGQTLQANLAVFQVRDVSNNLVYELYVAGADRTLRLWSPDGGLRSTSINETTGIVVPNDGTATIRAEVSALRNDSVTVRVDGVDRITLTGLAGGTTGNARYLRAGIDHYDTAGTTDTRTFFHKQVGITSEGWLATRTTPTGGAGTPRVTRACYDRWNDLRSVTSPKGSSGFPGCPSTAGPGYTPLQAPSTRYTTTLTYDAAHRLTQTRDPLAQTTETGYDANDQVTSATDQNGKVTTTDYDLRGLVTQVVQPFDTGRDLTAKNVYDKAGNVACAISPRAFDQGASDCASALATRFVYDGLSRLTRTALPSDASTPQAYVHQAFDPLGRLSLVSLPTANQALQPSDARTTTDYWDSGLIHASADGVNPRLRYGYAAAGQQALRVPETALASGELDFTRVLRWRYHPDGLLEEERDLQGNGIRHLYDLHGNATETTEPAGITSGGVAPLTIAAAYTGFDELQSVSQPKLGVSGCSLVTSYGYDLDGNLSSRAENAEQGTGCGGSPAPARTHSFGFDDAGQPTSQVDDFATPGNASDDERITTAYTPLGLEASRLLEKANGQGGWTAEQTVTRTYFQNALLKTLTAADGTAATVEQHTLAYITAGVYQDGNRVSDGFALAGPDPAAPCRNPASPCTASWAYDARGRLLSESDGTGSATSYQLDLAGNVTQQQKTGQPTISRTYTGLQLQTTSVGGSVAERSFYDPLGNLDCTTSNLGSQADCSPAQGASPSAQLLADYSYDYRNRLVTTRSYQNGSLQNQSTTSYDPLDRPLRQVDTSPAKTTLFSYVGLTTAVSQECDSSCATGETKRYGYDAQGRRSTISVTAAGPGATTRYSYLFDPHGSVSLLLDQANQVKASYGYTAYGAPNAALTKRAAGIPESLNPYRYTGKRWDPGSGTLDMGARRFNPTSTRFLQQDQYLGALDDLSLSLDPLTQNRYALAAGNPIGYVEVDGHSVACAQFGFFYGSCSWTGPGATLTNTTYGLTANPVTTTTRNVDWAANPNNFTSTGDASLPAPSSDSTGSGGESGARGDEGGFGGTGDGPLAYDPEGSAGPPQLVKWLAYTASGMRTLSFAGPEIGEHQGKRFGVVRVASLRARLFGRVGLLDNGAFGLDIAVIPLDLRGVPPGIEVDYTLSFAIRNADNKVKFVKVTNCPFNLCEANSGSYGQVNAQGMRKLDAGESIVGVRVAFTLFKDEFPLYPVRRITSWFETPIRSK